MRSAKSPRRKKFKIADHRLRDGATVVKSRLMNERQQARIDYFFVRIAHWRSLKRDESTPRMPASRDRA